MAGVAAFFTGLMLFAGGVNPFATIPRRLSMGSGSTHCCSTRA